MDDFREVLFGSSLNNLLGKLFTPHYTPLCLKTALVLSAYQALNPTVIIFYFKGGRVLIMINKALCGMKPSNLIMFL